MGTARLARAYTRSWVVTTCVGIIAVLSGCGAPCGLQQAGDRWYAATGLRAPKDTRWSFPETEYVPCADGVAAAKHYGCTRGRGRGPLEVAVAAQAPECSDVTMHEYGHVLGGEHSKAGVMASSKGDAGYSPECITREDVEAVCSVALCQWQRPECESFEAKRARLTKRAPKGAAM